IKTRPFKDFVAFNPTIGIEKPFRNTFSFETELMYRNRNWNSSGGEGDFGRFCNGDGFRILFGSKLYFWGYSRILYPEGQKAPFGWFATIQISYNYAITYDIDKRGTISGIYYNTVDSKTDWLEVNIGIGKQYYLFKTISLEFYFGPTLVPAHTEKMTIVNSENKNEIGNTVPENYYDTYIRPYLSLTIGYYIK
ncbi:MAG: hypothetical protein H8D45_23725, partial [Bacteroidetes bacterium]|nr:hypothetical protein [Bacteroidota bacterium]